MRIVNLMDKLWSLSFVLVVFVQYSTQSPRQSTTTTTTTVQPNTSSSPQPADVNAANNGQLLKSVNSDSGLSPSPSIALNTISPKTTYTKPEDKDLVGRRNLKGKDMISVDKLIIVASIVSGAIVALLVSIIVVYVCRRKYSTKSSSLQKVGNGDVKHGEPQEVYSVNEEGTDTFMGIPPNNQIWKELQMLPSSSSSVMSDSTVN